MDLNVWQVILLWLHATDHSLSRIELQRGGYITCNKHWMAPRILMLTQKSEWWTFSGIKFSDLKLSFIYFTSCNTQFSLFWVQISLHFMPVFMFFRHTAFFLVAGDELKSQNQQPQCKHGTSNQTPSKNSWQIFPYSVVRSNKVTIIHQTSLM